VRIEIQVSIDLTAAFAAVNSVSAAAAPKAAKAAKRAAKRATPRLSQNPSDPTKYVMRTEYVTAHVTKTPNTSPQKWNIVVLRNDSPISALSVVDEWMTARRALLALDTAFVNLHATDILPAVTPLPDDASADAVLEHAALVLRHIARDVATAEYDSVEARERALVAHAIAALRSNANADAIDVTDRVRQALADAHAAKLAEAEAAAYVEAEAREHAKLEAEHAANLAAEAAEAKPQPKPRATSKRNAA
jgi:hypothetical protein